MEDDKEDVLIFDDEGDKTVAAEKEEVEQPEIEEAEPEEVEAEEPRPGPKALSPDEKLKRRNATIRRERAENARKDRELAEMRDQLARVTHSTQILTADRVNSTVAEADEELRRGKELRRKAFNEGDHDLVDEADEIIFQARTKKQALANLRTQQRPSQTTQQQRAAEPNAERDSWISRNRWFNDPEHATRKAAVIAASNAAAAEGYDRNSREHFDRIDEVIGNISRKRPPPMTPSVQRGSGSGENPGVIRVPREVYNAWAKEGVFDGLSPAEKKATEKELALSYQQSVAKRKAIRERA